MNRPSRNEDDLPEWNQSPHELSGDLTTNSDLNGVVNSRKDRDHRDHQTDHIAQETFEVVSVDAREKNVVDNAGASSLKLEDAPANTHCDSVPAAHQSPSAKFRHPFLRAWQILLKFARFVGPGIMISVAYIDPGNYATDVAAGASYRFKLLVMVLISNVLAVFLQSLCIKLGSVTGLNLAEMVKENTPPWLNYVLYFFGEAAIIATDIAEVIGTAIGLNLLFNLPLVAGCAISIVDVLVILVFYKPTGSMRGMRAFELFVALLVLGVVICFCFQLSLIQNAGVGEVFRGYLPSNALVQGEG